MEVVDGMILRVRVCKEGGNYAIDDIFADDLIDA